MSEVKKGGRPSKYISLGISNLLDSIRGWSMEGSTNAEIARMLGVAESTLQDWKTKFPEFSEAIKKGRDISNGELICAAMDTARGYNIIEQVAIKLKRIKYENGKKVSEEEFVEVVELIKPVPKNPTMQIFMIKNRLPDKYRDRSPVSSGDDDSNDGNGNMSEMMDQIRESVKDHGLG